MIQIEKPQNRVPQEQNIRGVLRFFQVIMDTDGDVTSSMHTVLDKRLVKVYNLNSWHIQPLQR